MRLIVGILGVTLALMALADAFQTVVVARHGHRLPALTRCFYQASWMPASAIARRIRSDGRRERLLGLYAPLSLLVLVSLWAVSLIAAFAGLQWSLNPEPSAGAAGFLHEVFVSAESFSTLGAAAPSYRAERDLMALEALIGFSFLGLVISYLPVLYQSFSRRELRILLLDARAGSPPSALQLVLRHGADPAQVKQDLAEWEEWALDLLQSHLSYPMLAYYRSQHANQSWLAALTTVADASAVAMLSRIEDLRRQAELTFAAARHALVHTASIFGTAILPRSPDRLPREACEELRNRLAAVSSALRAEDIEPAALTRSRALYEPSAHALSAYFLMPLPPWISRQPATDNWRVNSWRGPPGTRPGRGRRSTAR